MTEPENEEEAAALAAVEAYLSQVPGYWPEPLQIHPYQDGYVVAGARNAFGGGLFLVRRGAVRKVRSNMQPSVAQVWAALVAEQS